jgi:ADP-ribosylglycohydrolase
MSSSPTRSESGSDERLARTESSMVWAAWADALGFISELTNESGLRRRIGTEPLTKPIAWSRRVGGKFGVAADLPVGCYSDDTQLRLATSRSISGHGFDVEAFARVELTVWPAYALGGGRASRAAASSMTKANASWSTNFYPGWTDAGGNGAAMRIQPHVWAASDLTEDAFVEDVLRNSIVTHGHPRALVGAVLQSVALAHALDKGRVPGLSEWPMLIDRTHAAFRFFYTNEDLAMFWTPRWEHETGRTLEVDWHATVDECAVMMDESELAVTRMMSAGVTGDVDAVSAHYRDLGHHLGLYANESRGSGTATVVAALALAAALPDHPAKSSIVAAQAVGTDTDTIATMAASIVGAADSFDLPHDVQDLVYLRAEAQRLYRIALHLTAQMFSYPDTLRWSPPQSQLDAVGLADGRPALGGMGWLDFTAGPYGNKDGVWSWARTSFGPSIIVKHRQNLTSLAQANWPIVRALKTGAPATSPRSEPGLDRRISKLRDVLPKNTQMKVTEAQPALFDAADVAVNVSTSATTSVRGSGPIDVDQILAWLKRNHFDDESLGYAVRRISQAGSVEQMALFLGTVRGAIRRRE